MSAPRPPSVPERVRTYNIVSYYHRNWTENAHTSIGYRENGFQGYDSVLNRVRGHVRTSNHLVFRPPSCPTRFLFTEQVHNNEGTTASSSYGVHPHGVKKGACPSEGKERRVSTNHYLCV